MINNQVDFMAFIVLSAKREWYVVMKQTTILVHPLNERLASNFQCSTKSSITSVLVKLIQRLVISFSQIE